MATQLTLPGNFMAEPTPAPATWQNVIVGDAVETLRGMPAGVFQCCVTSPPYWGLRDYGMEGQLGAEETPEEYVGHLVAVFAQVWRVMRDDGVLWLNLGDSYTANGKGGLKPKELVGIPWRVAFALQAAGWYLRSDCIWNKPNPMPESVVDRPTRAHEYIFMLTKSSKYYWNKAGATEPAVCKRKRGRALHGDLVSTNGNAGLGAHVVYETRNMRTVWEIPTHAFKGAHFATFPPELARRGLRMAAVGGRGPVLDPFCGSGTTLAVARELGLDGVGVELNPEYAEIARGRVAGAVAGAGAV